MPLSAGTKLGVYDIVSAIGAGGMGEVYRARDPKLGRDVAIKVLPEAFTGDAERVARFQREAQLLASLNHPHIADRRRVEAGTPLALFEPHVGGAVNTIVFNRQQYMVMPDGQRFLMNTVVDEASSTPITLIVNWKPRS